MAVSQSVLVYSKYRHDLPKFEKLLSQALPDIEINCADTPENAERYFAGTTIFYGWGFPAAWLSRMPRLQWVQRWAPVSTTSSAPGPSIATSC